MDSRSSTIGSTFEHRLSGAVADMHMDGLMLVAVEEEAVAILLKDSGLPAILCTSVEIASGLPPLPYGTEIPGGW
jgi:hypothetical protein